MKKNLFYCILAGAVLLCASISFFSCMSATTIANGLENAAYLELEGRAGKYSEVKVVLDSDESLAFIAKVNNIKKRSVSNKHSYKIATGTHLVEVFFNGERVASTNVFVSANQTKIIALP